MRNQIDYIITKIEYRRFLTNSKSYGATQTKTEHKHFKFESSFRYKARLNECKEKVDIAGFHDRLKIREHNSEIKNKIKQNKE